MLRRSPRLLAVKKEVGNNLTEDEEILMAPRYEIYHLSDKAPFFDMILTPTYVHSPRQLILPMAALSMLPSTAVPVVLRHGGKSWTVDYSGGSNLKPRFNVKWKSFVEDNCLKSGDACVFELIGPSSTKPVLKVHILRSDLPRELQASGRGKAANAPLVIN